MKAKKTKNEIPFTTSYIFISIIIWYILVFEAVRDNIPLCDMDTLNVVSGIAEVCSKFVRFQGERTKNKKEKEKVLIKCEFFKVVKKGTFNNLYSQKQDSEGEMCEWGTQWW